MLEGFVDVLVLFSRDLLKGIVQVCGKLHSLFGAHLPAWSVGLIAKNVEEVPVFYFHARLRDPSLNALKTFFVRNVVHSEYALHATVKICL